MNHLQKSPAFTARTAPYRKAIQRLNQALEGARQRNGSYYAKLEQEKLNRVRMLLFGCAP
jgi:hypothetical protein